MELHDPKSDLNILFRIRACILRIFFQPFLSKNFFVLDWYSMYSTLNRCPLLLKSSLWPYTDLHLHIDQKYICSTRRFCGSLDYTNLITIYSRAVDRQVIKRIYKQSSYNSITNWQHSWSWLSGIEKDFPTVNLYSYQEEKEYFAFKWRYETQQESPKT